VCFTYLGPVCLFCFFLCFWCISSCLFWVVSTSARSDCLERLVSEMTYYVSSGTSISTHSLTLQWHQHDVIYVSCCVENWRIIWLRPDRQQRMSWEQLVARRFGLVLKVKRMKQPAVPSQYMIVVSDIFHSSHSVLLFVLPCVLLAPWTVCSPCPMSLSQDISKSSPFILFIK